MENLPPDGSQISDESLTRLKKSLEDITLDTITRLMNDETLSPEEKLEILLKIESDNLHLPENDDDLI